MTRLPHPRIPAALRALFRLGALALFVIALIPAGLAAADATAPAAAGVETASPDVDALVDKYNPDIFKLNDDGSPAYVMKNAFQAGASDIATDVAGNNTFNLLVYLPFLVLPQVLLVIIIFRFRDRGDGRKPATFMGNHVLEVTWTLIPCLALVIVALPVWEVLYKMELPPKGVDTNDPHQATVIHVTGHEFFWEYEYKHEAQSISTFNKSQEALVLPRGRAVVMTLTSADVNHAWWVPAFGVKRDCIKGRDTFIWFTPNQDGVFKGSCAQLCGQGHGVMFISSVVVEPADYDLYISLLRQRSDAMPIWFALQRGAKQPPDQDGLKTAIAAYLQKEDSPARRFALRYWIAADFALMRHTWQEDRDMQDDIEATWKGKRALLDTLLAAVPAAPTPSAVHPAVPPAAPVALR
jgi:cytochrome c oxidase subunit 2